MCLELSGGGGIYIYFIVTFINQMLIMKTYKMPSLLLVVTVLAFGCSTPVSEPLTLASGSGSDPFGETQLTLAEIEANAANNPNATIVTPPAGYQYEYPAIAASPAYKVVLLVQQGEPTSEIYAYDLSLVSGPDPVLEAYCNQMLHEATDPAGYKVISCHSTGTECHTRTSDDGKTVTIITCPQD